jgi:hypothetical protein
MPPVGFEPAISAAERPKTHALDRAATGIGENGCERNKTKRMELCKSGLAPNWNAFWCNKKTLEESEKI